MAETHVGVVFFLGDKAYKLKKAVDLGFVDFRSREARLAACRNEVELNRRIAPDVYLGVADVVGVDGRTCDHLVVMRRMPADRRLSVLVARPGDPEVDTELARLARVLASFHRACASSPAIDEAATRDAQANRWEANALQMGAFVGDVLDGDALEEVMDLARRYLRGRSRAFEHRIAHGRARDGHGDLLADDIFCLDDGPRVLDCLDYDDRLRYGDVLADAAVLAVDLEHLGRPDLASAFLDHYREAAGDDWPASLAHHYLAYRAQARAVAACLRWRQGDAPSGSSAAHLLRLALDHLRRGRVRLTVVAGLPGTGKSTVSRALAERTGAVVLRSDDVRQELAGLAGTGRAPAGTNGSQPSMTTAVYTELLARAERLLAHGRSVILDGSFRHPEWRERAEELAATTVSDLVTLRCHVPLRVAVERIEARPRLATASWDSSDVTPAMLWALAVTDRPWGRATTLDTTQDLDSTVATAMACLDEPVEAPVSERS